MPPQFKSPFGDIGTQLQPFTLPTTVGTTATTPSTPPAAPAAAPVTPPTGYGTATGIWGARPYIGGGTQTTPIPAPYTEAQYNTAVAFLNQPPGAINPAMHPQGIDAGMRYIQQQKDIRTAYDAWLANPATTSTLPAGPDPAAAPARQQILRRARLGEQDLFQYSHGDIFDHAVESAYRGL